MKRYFFVAKIDEMTDKTNNFNLQEIFIRKQHIQGL